MIQNKRLSSMLPLYCRTHCQKKSSSRSPTLTQCAPCRPSFRYKVMHHSFICEHSCEFPWVSCLLSSFSLFFPLPQSPRNRHIYVMLILTTWSSPVCITTRVTCFSVVVAGQYWQSVKAYSGSVGLSYLAAERRDCEETDAVNALASLSVGVLSNKRYITHTQL